MKNLNENDGQDGSIRMPLPDRKENEMFARVENIFGGSRMNVTCDDGKMRLARIPGRKRRRLGKVKSDDLLIVVPWDIQNEKADIVYRYTKHQASLLSKRDILPAEVDIF